jgi:23S rRNA pseudouridine1911/1915/1917 synthase
VSAVEHFEVPDGLAGERADVGVSRLTGMSRNQAANLISDGHVTIDGDPVGRSTRLVAGTKMRVAPGPAHDDAASVSSEPVVDLEVVYIDEDIVVVTKPVGVAAHPSPGWRGPTVTAGLPAVGISLASEGASEREGVVHRLDVGTSGLMVLARSPRAYTSLKHQFKEREVSKTYHALVQGHPDPSTGTVNAPIGRHPAHDYRFAVVNGGKPSVTHYRTIEAYPYASLLEIGLETGRTHQIRVHMSALRHPCCGDMTYGADPVLAQRLGLGRQWLHAVELTFTHPGTGERVSFTSPYPADLSNALTILADS